MGKVCFTLPVKPQSTLIFFTHLTQYTRTQRPSQAVCQLSANALRLLSLFFLKSFSKPVTQQKQECYFLSEIRYRCNPPMVLSGKTNEHQFSFNAFSLHADSSLHTHQIFSCTSRGHTLLHSRSRHSVCCRFCLFLLFDEVECPQGTVTILRAATEHKRSGICFLGCIHHHKKKERKVCFAPKGSFWPIKTLALNALIV